VRELKNVIARACMLAPGAVINTVDLGLPAGAPPPIVAPLGDLEPDRDLVAQALARANGVVAQAAAELGLSRQALYRRMARLGVPRPG
jgi:transcriptional regulator of acetoin/glycerol metabolism